ncbi:hypothetical protein EGT07_13050 [Herbaspirillum sp. HC18]|nr:hypothetical protein EGT07_13050 [Herbaspirillum sp. HC18]
MKHLLPTGKRWSSTLVDAGDESADCVLPFPEELLASMGWKEGDMLRVTVEESGRLIAERVD